MRLLQILQTGLLVWILAQLIHIKRQGECIMATGREIKDAANAIRTGLSNLVTRVDKLIADIQSPAVEDVTASDEALTELKSIAEDLDKFHAPLEVVGTVPTP